MAGTLPAFGDCCLPCESPVTVLVPGPAGADGAAGAAGADGDAAYTHLTAQFIMPAIGATVIAAVGSSDGMIVGQYVPVEFGGTMQVTAKPDSQHVTLRNSAECPENVIAGTVIPVGAIVGPPATFNMSGLVWNILEVP